MEGKAVNSSSLAGSRVLLESVSPRVPRPVVGTKRPGVQ